MNGKIKKIIVFDGLCNFCNGAVNFIIKRDPISLFSFTPIQGKLAQQLLKEHGINQYNHDTLFLITDNKVYTLSSAALEICKDLSGHWYLFRVFKIIPSPLRDLFYKLFARYRYKLYGRRASCRIPDENIKSRFL